MHLSNQRSRKSNPIVCGKLIISVILGPLACADRSVAPLSVPSEQPQATRSRPPALSAAASKSPSVDSALFAIAEEWAAQDAPQLKQLLSGPEWSGARRAARRTTQQAIDPAQATYFDGGSEPTLSEMEALISAYNNNMWSPEVFSSSSVAAFGPGLLTSVVGSSTMEFLGDIGETVASVAVTGEESAVLQMNGTASGAPLCSVNSGGVSFASAKAYILCRLSSAASRRVLTTSAAPYSFSFGCGLTATASGSHTAYATKLPITITDGAVSIGLPSDVRLSRTKTDHPMTASKPACVVPTVSVNAGTGAGVVWSGETLTTDPGPQTVFLGSTWSSTKANDFFTWAWNVNGSPIAQISQFSLTLAPATYVFQLVLTNSDNKSASASVTVVVPEPGYGGGPGGGGGGGGEEEECERCQQWFWYQNGEIIDEWWECTEVDPRWCSGSEQ